MDRSTILIVLAIIGGLVALLGGLIWFDVVLRGNAPPEPTGTADLPPAELGPRWTGGLDYGPGGGWDGGGSPGGFDGGGGDGGGSSG